MPLSVELVPFSAPSDPSTVEVPILLSLSLDFSLYQPQPQSSQRERVEERDFSIVSWATLRLVSCSSAGWRSSSRED